MSSKGFKIIVKEGKIMLFGSFNLSSKTISIQKDMEIGFISSF